MGLPLNAYYRMDGEIGTDRTLRWSLREVLAPARIRADQLGVVGWVDGDSGKVYVPLFVTPEAVAGAQRGGSVIELVVRSPVDVEDIKWRFDAESAWGDAPQRSAWAGDPIRLPVPEVSQDRIEIDIRAKRRSRRSTVKLYGLSILLVE